MGDPHPVDWKTWTGTERWLGHPPKMDDFGRHVKKEFIDGKTTMGPWGIMTPTSFKLYGIGIGVGLGQRYRLNPFDGVWYKVEG